MYFQMQNSKVSGIKIEIRARLFNLNFDVSGFHSTVFANKLYAIKYIVF